MKVFTLKAIIIIYDCKGMRISSFQGGKYSLLGGIFSLSTTLSDKTTLIFTNLPLDNLSHYKPSMH